MKIVFAGPSLHGENLKLAETHIAPPVAHGDVYRAVRQGYSVIGIVDGIFDTSMSVWHKEILYALDQGVKMFGAASMGALRAAECYPFGMEPVGAIAQGFVDGRFQDDSVVAVLHAPPELGSAPITEPMVDVWATLKNLREKQLITDEQNQLIADSADSIYFKERTIRAIFQGLDNGASLKAKYGRYHIGRKKLDAIQLVKAVEAERLS